MRLFRFIILLSSAVLLTACKDNSPPQTAEISSGEEITRYVQELEHLDLNLPDKSFTPLNYKEQRGIWYPFMDYESYMLGKSEDEFRSFVRNMFKQAKEQSFNTVYVHVRPYGDAYYNSQLFPKGTFLDGDYDPLLIMTEEAHSLSLSIHAWINPLRCQTVEEMKNIPDSFTIKKWVDSNTGTFINIVNNRYYLNPAYDEVRQLICGGAEEILRNYEVDGIHIDDYFYPCTAPEFDSIAFKNSGSSDLAQWRLDNCSKLVKSLYDTVKKSDSRLVFGISPQGNINANYSTQYADVKLWCSTPGYCDYIVPQIYFGFNNETCPFAETLSAWESLVTCPDVSLIIGLGAYKLGKEDKWAGSAGEAEWIENPNIIQQQIELAEQSTASGYALYY